MDTPVKVAIYALRDVKGVIRYVGRAANPARRFKQHRKVKVWVASYEIIEWCQENEWQEYEIFWIQEYRSRGYPLENMTRGGDGLVNPSAEVRARISRTLKSKGIKLPEWHRKKLSEANRNKVVTEETRTKLSKGKRGERNPFFGTTPWNFGKQQSGMTGKRHSAATREEMSRVAKERGHHQNFRKVGIGTVKNA